MVLDGWNSNKVIKLQIDHTKIDEDLTDFPILVKLSGSSGITSTSCLNILNEFPITTTSGNIDSRDSYVKLLIQSTSTVADTSFVDNSAAHREVTTVGNCQTSIASALLFNKGYGISHDGTTDYLQVNYHSDFNLGASDCTIEQWFFPLHTGKDQRLLCSHNGTSGWYLAVNGTNTMGFYLGSGIAVSLTSTTLITSLIGTWVHIAAVRYGDVWTLYINGVAEATSTVAGTVSVTSLYVRTTRIDTQTAYDFCGLVQDVTLSVGIARYTSNFTPATQSIFDNRLYYTSPPPTKFAVIQPSTQEHYIQEEDSNTVFLLHSDTISGSTTFVDSSPTECSFTAIGTPKHTTVNQKFGATAIYCGPTSTALYTNTSSAFAFSLDDFTIDFWFLMPSVGFGRYIFDFGANGVAFSMDTVSQIRIYSSSLGTGTTLFTNGPILQINTWYHLAAVRKNLLLTGYCNGVAWGSATFTLSIAACAVNLARYGGGGYYADGYYDEVHIQRGAKWDTDFDVPSSPYADVATAPFVVKSATIPGGDSNLYCEVDAWRVHGIVNEAYLWIKVPKILSDQPTDLLLFYDNDHADNSDYVGETGSTPAKNVWTDHIAVYHCTGITSSGTTSMLDSTTNALHQRGGQWCLTYSPVYGFWLNYIGNSSYFLSEYYSGSLTTGISLEAFVNPIDTSTDHMLAFGGTTNYRAMTLYNNGMLSSSNGTSWTCSLATPAALANTEYYHYGVWNSSIARSSQWSNFSESIALDTPEAFPFTQEVKEIHIGISFDNVAATKLYGKVKEVRITNTAKTPAWFKATYYSQLDQLITFITDPITLYKVSGYITQQGSPVQRQVCLYNRTTGGLMSSTTSDSAGFYYLETTSSGSHTLVCYDADGGEDYNDIIVSKVYPTEAG